MRVRFPFADMEAEFGVSFKEKRKLRQDLPGISSILDRAEQAKLFAGNRAHGCAVCVWCCERASERFARSQVS